MVIPKMWFSFSSITLLTIERGKKFYIFIIMFTRRSCYIWHFIGCSSKRYVAAATKLIKITLYQSRDVAVTAIAIRPGR
jgi:hypothetical protein